MKSSWNLTSEIKPDIDEAVEFSNDGKTVEGTLLYLANRTCMLAGTAGGHGYFGEGFATDGEDCDYGLICDDPEYWRPRELTAYKLVRQMADGSFSPLFINKKSRMPIDEWMEAEDHPTKGFAHRPGWHCVLEPKAPHLSMNPKSDRPRVWVKVLVYDYEEFNRPENQGGTWILAKKMKVLEVL